MDLDQVIAPLDIHTVAVALGVAMLVAWQIGRRFGGRLRGRDAIKPSKFDDASIGLLGPPCFQLRNFNRETRQRRLAVVGTPTQLATSTLAPACLRTEPKQMKT